MLPEPILISDQEIKEGDWFYHPNKAFKSQIEQADEFTFNASIPIINGFNGYVCKKIIAGVSSLISIDFSLLSEEDCKKIGWIDVEKYKATHLTSFIWEPAKEWKFHYEEGFKTAQNLNKDKMFSLDDIKTSFWKCFENRSLGYSVTMGELELELNKSLQQPKVFDVEVEMETIWFNKRSGGTWQPFPDEETAISKKQPKITNNSIKVNKIL